jgi:hypothetical protein
MENENLLFCPNCKHKIVLKQEPIQNNGFQGLEQAGYKIPPPLEDSVFRYRFNRANPSQEQWGEIRDDGSGGQVGFIPERFESIKGEGNFVYWYGCPFPSKTYAPVEAIYAVCPVKRLFIDAIRFLTTIHKKGRINRICSYFNEISDLTMRPYYLDGCYCKFVKEIQKGVKAFLVNLWVNEDVAEKTAENFGAMFEFDNAYRIPAQDIMAEANKEELLRNFPKEMERLLKIHADRTPDKEAKPIDSFKRGANVLKVIWWIPKFKKDIKEAINAINWDNVKLDEADIFYSLLYGDYDTKGLNIAERIAIYNAMFPDGNLPPRIKVINKR